MGRRTIAILMLVVAILMLSIVGVLYVLQQDQPPAASPDPGNDFPPGEDVAPEDQPPGVVAPEATPETREVVVSLQTVPRGWQLTAAELTTDNRLIETISENVITDIDEVIGMYARTDILQGETITRDKLARDPRLIGIEDYGPSSLIPPGFIAAAVPMDRLASVAYGLAEGDYVDIMITFLWYQIDEQFQTYLPNAAVFFLEEALEAAETGETPEGQEIGPQTPFVIFPYGRFEQLPTEDLAHIKPSEPQRPIPVAIILQNARVIQVGPWEPLGPVTLPTPTPVIVEGEPTPTPSPFDITPTPPRPDVLLVALSPQQQLLLKYAVESNANIDFALRGAGDGQVYAIQNVDLNYLLERFGIQVPANFNYSVDAPIINVTVTPVPEPGQEAPLPGE